MTNDYYWRKTSDINREYALFELLDDSDVALLDAGFNDQGVFEVVFNPSISGKILGWEHFVQLIENGKSLALEDR
jgi:hypothetical protein